MVSADSCSVCHIPSVKPVRANSAAATSALGALGVEAFELRLDLAPFLLLALDVDLPARQLRGETDVLALLADGQRELPVLDDDFHHLLGFVDDRHSLHAGRADSVSHERHGVVRPRDDVDLLSPQFPND